IYQRVNPTCHPTCQFKASVQMCQFKASVQMCQLNVPVQCVSLM
ncbi:556_t:CDS:1, partial [Racocetra persica]